VTSSEGLMGHLSSSEVAILNAHDGILLGLHGLVVGLAEKSNEVGFRGECRAHVPLRSPRHPGQQVRQSRPNQLLWLGTFHEARYWRRPSNKMRVLGFLVGIIDDWSNLKRTDLIFKGGATSLGVLKLGSDLFCVQICHGVCYWFLQSAAAELIF